MKVQKAESIVCYDVDGTLIKYLETKPYETVHFITDPYNNVTKRVFAHENHIDLLKSHKGRGYYVKVWSAAGVRWAEAVIKALNLEKYVDAVETKPTSLVDDLPVEKIFPQRIFLEDT